MCPPLAAHWYTVLAADPKHAVCAFCCSHAGGACVSGCRQMPTAEGLLQQQQQVLVRLCRQQWRLSGMR